MIQSQSLLRFQRIGGCLMMLVEIHSSLTTLFALHSVFVVFGLAPNTLHRDESLKSFSFSAGKTKMISACHLSLRRQCSVNSHVLHRAHTSNSRLFRCGRNEGERRCEFRVGQYFKPRFIVILGGRRYAINKAPARWIITDIRFQQRWFSCTLYGFEGFVVTIDAQQPLREKET